MSEYLTVPMDREACVKWHERTKKPIFSAGVDEKLIEVLNALVGAAIEDAVRLAIEEHEAALCPEDYGCKEYIASLQRQVARARLEEAEYIRENTARLAGGSVGPWLKEHIDALRAALASPATP